MIELLNGKEAFFFLREQDERELLCCHVHDETSQCGIP